MSAREGRGKGVDKLLAADVVGASEGGGEHNDGHGELHGCFCCLMMMW